MNIPQQEDYILSKFERDLSRSTYKLVRKYVVDSEHPSAIIMTPEGYPYCIIKIICVKTCFPNKKIKIKTKNAKAKFAIITDGNIYQLFENNGSCVKKLNYNNYEEIIKKLLEKNENNDKTQICDYIKGNLDIRIEKDDIKFGQDFTVFIENKQKEEELINNLFHFEDFGGTVYRYIPLESLFKTLQNSTIRMSGLPGMNDVSEVDYVEKFLYGKSLNSDEINNIFILSCSIDKDDDLTQWRLYADDAKGARLKFNNFNKKDDAFTFRKIKYIDTDFEPLKKLKGLVEYVKRVTGYTFVFKTLHEWCHFIKPKDYAIESEVRLLYNSSKSRKVLHRSDDWLFAYGTSIANPFIDLSLSNLYNKDDKEVFPLKLVDIKLGPKCPERETNKSQLRKLIQEKKNIFKITQKQKGKKFFYVYRTNRSLLEKLILVNAKKKETIDVSYSSIKHYR
ncbi:DUF2971 domain-containing protein [bacterium]|nr:DUF2971 domain-containing protein [bacterium]